MDIKKQVARAFQECKIRAIKAMKTCLHPQCNEKAINSHILQKNGILSKISTNGHVVQPSINAFYDNKYVLKEVGINEAFSFNCFCPFHDTELFKSIEVEEIDFSNYSNLILFTVRTILNEKFRKLVNASMYECLMSNYSDLFDMNFLKGHLHEEKLGITDIEKIEKLIWSDINNEEESFIFRTREIQYKDICLSAFYNYETSQELQFYYMMNGKEKEDVVDIFINLFPYKNKTILIIGYQKKHERIVSDYVDSFFKVNEEKLEIMLTNLMLFLCETWAISKNFYDNVFKGNDYILNDSVRFSANNYNERQLFDINIFSKDFLKQFAVFKQEQML